MIIQKLGPGRNDEKGRASWTNSIIALIIGDYQVMSMILFAFTTTTDLGHPSEEGKAKADAAGTPIMTKRSGKIYQIASSAGGTEYIGTPLAGDDD